MTSSCYVWKWLRGETDPVVAGQLRIDGKGNQAFAYGRSYLARKEAEPIYAPELPLGRGTQEPPAGLGGFSSLRDASPDAWGRRVIHARLAGRADAAPLDELSYMLESGSDRFGALDFQASPTEYVPRSQDEASLGDLQEAVEVLHKDLPIPPDLEAALFHGSSIGGARPKATIADGSTKYIAKFSLSADAYDLVSAEFLAMRLAERANIDVAPVKLEEAAGRSVLLVERFDRRVARGGGAWERFPTVSGLTVLGLDERWAREASYPGIVERLKLHGQEFKRDARELFHRMVFNVLIGNTDDHARNHAFFVEGENLRLTPAYDLCAFNRSGGEASHAMKLSGEQNLSRLGLCLTAASGFGIEGAEAEKIIAKLVETVGEGFAAVCEEGRITNTTQALLWRRAVLNPDIFDDPFRDLDAFT